MHPRPVHTRIQIRRGFTLIELLTVIAIIGILAAIIIPTVAKVRNTAKKAQCVTRLREWGAAVNLCAGEYKQHVALFPSQGSFSYANYFPGKNMNVEGEVGATALKTVMQAMSICPTGINGGNSMANVQQYAFVVPIGATKKMPNVFDRYSEVEFYKTTEAASPSKLLLMIEVSNQRTVKASNTGQIESALTADTSVSRMQTIDGYVRHGGTAMALFLDGHVSGLSIRDTNYAESKDTLDQYFTLK